MNGSGRRLKGLTNAITHNICTIHITYMHIYITIYNPIVLFRDKNIHAVCLSEKCSKGLYRSL